MNDPNSLASLPFDQITQSPVWQNSTVEDRVQITNKYYTDLAASMAGTDDDTDENRQKLATVRRAAIYEVAPFLKQPEDIGVMENVSNAFTKSMSSFHENITLNLLEQNPEEAARYHREMERIYPTREGFSEKVGRITGMMLPTGAALLSAPVTGPLGLTGAAAIATGALYGASSAGAALGDIYAYEQATGEDVSSGKTAAILAGHAAFEMLTETAGFGKLLGIARRTGSAIGSQTAEAAGRAILSGSKGQTMRGVADAVSDYFTHNRAARLSLGWVQMGAVEGVEEMASQIGQNFTDKLYRESPILEGLIQTFEEGALGGLLLGPLAIGVQAGQASRVRESMYQQSKVLLNETLMAEARRKGGKDEVAVGVLYDELSSAMTPERIDQSAFSNPDFMMIKELQGMTGTELLPVLGSEGSKWKAVRYTAKDGTPIVLLNTRAGNTATVKFAAMHDLFHGLETVLGQQGSIEAARKLASEVPEFAQYKADLDAAYRAKQMGETTQDYAISEITADIFGPTFFQPKFQRAAIKLAAENPAIGKEVVARLRDMRSRFERMGRRVDAQIAYSTKAYAEAAAKDIARGDGKITEQLKLEDAGVPILRLPAAAMQAAKAKIDDTTTYLDRITGNFVKGFGEALALKEKTEAQAKVQGDTGEEDLVTGETVAPLSVNERPGEPSAEQRLASRIKEFGWKPEDYGMTPEQVDMLSAQEDARRQAYADWQKGTAKPDESLSGAVLTRFTVAGGTGLFSRSAFDLGKLSDGEVLEVQDGMVGLMQPTGLAPMGSVFYFTPDGLKQHSRIIELLQKAAVGPVQITKVSADAVKPVWVSGEGQVAVAPEAPLSIIESITPEEIFARAFDAKNTQFKKSPEGEALKAVWNNSTRTSWVLDKVFGQTRFSAPPASQDQSSAAYRLRKAYDALPAWVKSEDGVEWGRTEFFSKFGKVLGVSGIDPNETALGYLRDQTLTPDESATGTNEDHVLENLASLVREHKTKGDFRKAVGAMAQEELKANLEDLSRRKVSKEIERLRITRQMAFDLPPATIQKVADISVKNPMQRLVSRDDLRAGDVVLQKGTLYWLRGFDADGSPEAVVMRGQEKPFDDSPAALDDPNQDPDIAQDYRFGKEALPVTPYYGVEVFFDPNWSENPDIMAMVDDAQIAVEKPAMPWEGEAPMSVNEGLRPRSVGYYGDIEVIRNPTPEDYQAITAEYRREFPMDRSGDPTTRFTTDAVGNRWIWRADAGIHSFVEPLITAREGVSVNQNAANFARRQASLSVNEGPRLYREVSAESALELHPLTRADSPFGVPDMFFSTTPELALGQGMNKGVLLEFSGGFPSRPAMSKPGADLVSQMGGGEERTARIQPGELRKHLVGMTVQKRAMGSRSELFRLNKWINQLESEGWTKTVGKNGSITVRKPPESVAPMSISETLTQDDLKRMGGSYAAEENIFRRRVDYASESAQAKRQLDAGKTHGEKQTIAERMSRDGLTSGAVRVFAFRQIVESALGAASFDNAARLAYFGYQGNPDADKLILADIRKAQLRAAEELSAAGTTLGAASYSPEGLPYSSHKNRWVGWYKTAFDLFGIPRDKANLSDRAADAVLREVRQAGTDALASMLDQFRTMPEGEFEPAIRAFVVDRRRDRFMAKLAERRKKPAAPLSVAEEAAGGELFDRIFADFGTYYRRLKSPVGAALRTEIAEAYGQDMVDDLVAEMEGHAALFPDLAEGKADAPVPAPVKEVVTDMFKAIDKKAQAALKAELAAIYKGEVQDILREEYEQTIAPASLKRAAKAAVMTEAEQAKAIDAAVKDLAAAVFKRLKNRQGGAQLVKDGVLTEAGVLRDLQPLRERMLEAEMPMNVLKGAVNEIMSQTNVTISDFLKLSRETFGIVSLKIADEVSDRLAKVLKRTPALMNYPDEVAAAAARAGRAVEAMLLKRLEDRLDSLNNTQMLDYNLQRQAATRFLGRLMPVVTYGAKPFRDTAKGAASILLGDAAGWKARLSEGLKEASTKAVMLGEDILPALQEGLGLPDTAMLPEVEAALRAVKIPETLAKAAVREHLEQTGRSLRDLAMALDGRPQAVVVNELAAEFGEDSRDVWAATLADMVGERAKLMAKRMTTPKTRKDSQRMDVLDRLLFVASSGQFDDAALMDLIAEQAGMPPLSAETKAKLEVLVQKELDAIIETGDPRSSLVQPFTREIATLLAEEAIAGWPKSSFWKIGKRERELMVSASYSSALSGPKTWLITNPSGSGLKTFATMLEMAERNALADPVLKKGGFTGAMRAWEYAMRSLSTDQIKAAMKDAVVPGKISRKLSLGASYVDAGLFRTVGKSLEGISPKLAEMFGALAQFTWGNVAKYVPRMIWSGDVAFHNAMHEYGAFEAARKSVMIEHPDWTNNQVIDRVYELLGTTQAGRPMEKYMVKAREQAEKLFGPNQPEYRVVNRAYELARADRSDTLFAAGDFAAGQGTYTGTIGVGYAEVEGAYVPQGKEAPVLDRLNQFLNDTKQAENPVVALVATALAPFTSIASRIMDATFSYTLFPGIMRYQEMKGLAAKAEPGSEIQRSYEEGAQLQLVRMVNGTLVTAAMILLAAASRDDEDPWFKITGAGPKDFRKNWQWRESGNRPFTITVGGVQLDYRTSPLYAFLAATGTWADQSTEAAEDQAGLVSAWSLGFLSSLQNQSFMTSIADLLGALSGRDESAGQQKLLSLIVNPATTAMIPASGALRQIEETFFPYPNASRIEDNFFKTFARTAIARMPVANGVLPRKVNALGREIENDRPMETTVGLAGWKRGGDDDAAKVFDWAVGKQAWIPTPSVFQTRLMPPEDSMTVGERRQAAADREAMMTFDQYTEFLKRRGDIIIAIFQKYEPELAKIPAGDGAKALMSEIASRASAQAKREMRGWRPVKTGGEPMDRAIREKVREALKTEASS